MLEVSFLFRKVTSIFAFRSTTDIGAENMV
jgi:hypothetical protein